MGFFCFLLDQFICGLNRVGVLSAFEFDQI